MGAYKFDLGDGNQYLRWNGYNLFVNGIITIKSSSTGIANLADAGALATLDSIAYAAITGAKPPTNADHTADVVSNLAYYNMVTKALLDSTIIIGGFIKTSLLTATNIRTGTLRSVRVQVGGGTNEDIYFEDSGIRLFDYGSGVAFKKSTAEFFRIFYTSVNAWIATDRTNMNFATPTKSFTLFGTGTLGLPVLTSAPAAFPGIITPTDEGGDTRISFYVASWQHCQDSGGW